MRSISRLPDFVKTLTHVFVSVVLKRRLAAGSLLQDDGLQQDQDQADDRAARDHARAGASFAGASCLRPQRLIGIRWIANVNLPRGIATNGHTLGTAILRAGGQAGDPKRYVLEPVHVRLALYGPNTGNVAVKVNETHAFITHGDVEVVGRILDGQFPNWQIVVPKDSTGDTITLHLPGGGGWGDPLQRDPGAVLAHGEMVRVLASLG